MENRERWSVILFPLILRLLERLSSGEIRRIFVGIISTKDTPVDFIIKRVNEKIAMSDIRFFIRF